jgi:hypothetical protein
MVSDLGIDGRILILKYVYRARIGYNWLRISPTGVD